MQVGPAHDWYIIPTSPATSLSPPILMPWDSTSLPNTNVPYSPSTSSSRSRLTTTPPNLPPSPSITSTTSDLYASSARPELQSDPSAESGRKIASPVIGGALGVALVGLAIWFVIWWKQGPRRTQMHGSGQNSHNLARVASARGEEARKGKE
ncbi:uncharacterized protein BDR25DRAFT_318735 [Lindgomyces ingoldianus]|uniref:Uncharacterized protein n=1 Tax=Lindgomyces ingoldianus TaxID=673940 RepID=A0ACB6QDI8_9PLEO|nr:uncharacterized protein BDR25DRAFT_318735 [Lindgomyces ingoldianus]KAF2465018.1 hypothetical protein BDR25DRAFT_318735 [Lindgomyces ingoldianus]